VRRIKECDLLVKDLDCDAFTGLLVDPLVHDGEGPAAEFVFQLIKV